MPRPFEGAESARQIVEVGSRSVPLILACGFAVGAGIGAELAGIRVTG